MSENHKAIAETIYCIGTVLAVTIVLIYLGVIG
jgi:hypothetical protein